MAKLRAVLDEFFLPVNKATCPLSEIQLKQGVLNGTIPFVASDTVATSSAFLHTDLVIITGKQSTTIFHFPNEGTAAASIMGNTHHKFISPEKTKNIVPSLVGKSLRST